MNMNFSVGDIYQCNKIKLNSQFYKINNVILILFKYGGYSRVPIPQDGG